MAIIRTCLSFTAGAVFGVYVAQNYNVPSMQKLVNTAVFMAKIVEQGYRKPKKPGDDDSA